MDEKQLEYMAQMYIHPPAKTVGGFLQVAEDILAESTGEQLTFGTPSVDSAVLPFRRSKVYSFIGRPGHGKTSMLNYLANRFAKTVSEDEYVLYVTFETPVEELELYYLSLLSGGKVSITDIAWGRFNIDELKSYTPDRLKLPIWIMGKSIRDGFIKSNLTIEAIAELIEHTFVKTGMRPRAILLDYIQKIPSDKWGLVEDRYKTVTQATFQIRNLGIEANTPILVGVQAKQTVDLRADPRPGTSDAEWSAAIVQESDAVFGLWKPKKDFPGKQLIELGGERYYNTHNFFVLGLLKQRLDEGVNSFPLSFDMSTLTMGDARPM